MRSPTTQRSDQCSILNTQFSLDGNSELSIGQIFCSVSQRKPVVAVPFNQTIKLGWAPRSGWVRVHRQLFFQHGIVQSPGPLHPIGPHKQGLIAHHHINETRGPGSFTSIGHAWSVYYRALCERPGGHRPPLRSDFSRRVSIYTSIRRL